MELQVNDQIRIAFESPSYTVQKSRIADKDTKKHKKGDLVWDFISSHGNLPDACRSMLSKGILMQDSFNTVMAYVNKVEKMILDLKQKTK